MLKPLSIVFLILIFIIGCTKLSLDTEITLSDQIVVGFGNDISDIFYDIKKMFDIDHNILIVIEWILIGIIIIGGLVWQLNLFENDQISGPNRIYIPIYFTIIVLVGIIGQGAISYMDDRVHNFSTTDFFNNLLVVLVFGIGFTLKAYFAPVLLSAALAFMTYNLFEFGEFMTIPFLDTFLHFVFKSLPKWLEQLYIILVAIYMLVGAIRDSS
jgi:uncharacterized membrane protein YqhA